MKYSEKRNEFIKEKYRGFPLLNFKGDPGVPLLNFEGGPGVPLLNFRGSHVLLLDLEIPSPGVLVSLLHHA